MARPDAQVGQHLRGHREARRVGLEHGHEHVGAPHDGGQVLVGLEVQEHEVVGGRTVVALPALEPVASLALGDHHDPGVGVRLPQPLGDQRQDARVVLQAERARVQHDRVAAQARARPPGVVRSAHGQLVDGRPVGHDGGLVGDAPGGQPLEERRRDRHDRRAPPGDRALEALRHPADQWTEHRQAPARRRTDGLRVDVLVPEHHRHAAARQAPGQDRVRQQRHVADDRHRRVLGGDGPGGPPAVGELLADAGERRVLGEGRRPWRTARRRGWPGRPARGRASPSPSRTTGSAGA